MLGNFSFGAVKLSNNVDPDEHFYSGYDNGFDARDSFLLFDGSRFDKKRKNICYRYELIFAIDNTKKDIMILCKVPTDGLDDTTVIAEKEYYINFTEQQKQFCLVLHYTGLNSYIFVNGVEIYKSKQKILK